jgi:hypothetical protein
MKPTNELLQDLVDLGKKPMSTINSVCVISIKLEDAADIAAELLVLREKVNNPVWMLNKLKELSK